VNAAVVQRVRAFAASHNLTPRAVTLAYVLSQPFPVIGIVGLPTLLTERRVEYERASAIVLSEAERSALAGSTGAGLS
jgi:aryl-alcohol dehydrogenase-like predicted oxidoreductase